MAWGGARKGAGRKPVADEVQTREKAQAAIITKYGSLEAGIESLLDTGEPSLIKFVYEHALGKPQDHIDLTSQGKQLPAITGMVIK